MKSKVPHLKYYFIGTFAVLSLSITAWQWMYEIPRKKCEAAGHWWTWEEKCVVPVRLYDITGRKPETPPAATKAP